MQYHFLRINEISFAFNSLKDLELNNIDLNKVNMTLGRLFDLNKNILEVSAFILFEIEENSLFHIELEFFFELQNFKEIVIKDGDDINIQQEFAEDISFHVYSTSRGILYEKLSHTEYNELILPFLGKDELNKILDSDD